MTETLRETAEKYGPKVRWCRQGARLSGRELCRRIGISPAYLSDIETGRRLPAPDVSDRIADAIGIDRDGLWRLALHERLLALHERLSERDLRTLARSESPPPEGPHHLLWPPHPGDGYLSSALCSCGEFQWDADSQGGLFNATRDVLRDWTAHTVESPSPEGLTASTIHAGMIEHGWTCTGTHAVGEALCQNIAALIAYLAAARLRSSADSGTEVVDVTPRSVEDLLDG